MTSFPPHQWWWKNSKKEKRKKKKKKKKKKSDSTTKPAIMGSIVQESGFQHILRMLNTNIDGRQKVMYALTAIKGCGRRFANIVCKKADVDMTKR